MRTFCEATGQLPTLTSLTTSKLDFAVRPDLMETFVQQATTLTPEQVKQVTVPQFAKINALAGRRAGEGVPRWTLARRHHGRPGRGGERAGQ